MRQASAPVSRLVSRFSLVLLATWVTFFVAVVWPVYAFIGTPPVTPDMMRQIVAARAWLAPEPAERTAFLLGIVVLPPTAFAFDRLFTRLSANWSALGWWRAGVWGLALGNVAFVLAGRGLEAPVTLVVGTALVVGLAYAFRPPAPDTERPTPWFWQRGGAVLLVLVPFAEWWVDGGLSLGRYYTAAWSVWAAWWVGLPACALVGVLVWRRAAWPLAVLGVALVVGVDSLKVVAEGELTSVTTHFEAFTASFSTVAAGGTLLVDAASQYGAYAHVLAPLTQLFASPLSPTSISVVMSLVTAAVHLLWLVFLLKVMTHKPVACVTWLASVAVADTFVPFMAAHTHHEAFTPYFQFQPLRTFALTLALVVGAWHNARPSPARLAVAALVTSSLVVWWNPEMGLVAWGGALAGCVVAQGLRWRSVGASALAFVLSLAAMVAAYSLFTRARADAWPNWPLLFAASNTFYVFGVSMLPKTQFQPWLVVTSVYLVALLSVGRGLWADGGRGSPFGGNVTLLAVVGVGVFTYYQGRSNDRSLPPVSFPALMLVGLALDQRFDRRRSALTQAGTAVLSFMAASGVAAWPELNDSVVLGRTPQAQELDEWAQDLAAYRAISHPGEARFILSPGPTVFHLAGQTRQLGRYGIKELVTRAQVQDLERLVLAPGALPVVVDRRYRDDVFENQVLAGVFTRWLERCFVLEATSVSGRIAVWRAAHPGAPCSGLDDESATGRPERVTSPAP